MKSRIVLSVFAAIFIGSSPAYAGYVGNDPINNIDPYGESTVAVTYFDQDHEKNAQGDTVNVVGHQGILGIDDATGETTYLEFGRYPSNEPGTPNGAVRGRDVPDLVMGDDGKFTSESVGALVDTIGGF